MNTVQEKYFERYCSFMPVEIFLSKANAEPEYDTIDEADVLDTDTVVEHITEETKGRRRGRAEAESEDRKTSGIYQ